MLLLYLGKKTRSHIFNMLIILIDERYKQFMLIPLPSLTVENQGDISVTRAQSGKYSPVILQFFHFFSKGQCLNKIWHRSEKSIMQVHLPWHGECEPFTTVRWFGSCPQTGQKAKRKVSAGFLLQASCLVFQRLLYIWVCTYGCVLISIFFFREPVILGDSPYCLIFSQLLLSRPHIWVQTHSDFTLQNEDLNSCNGGNS